MLTLASDYFNTGKVDLAADGSPPAWNAADIVLTDDVNRLEAAARCTLAELSANNRSTVFGVASIFGMTGPLARVPAVPLDAQAASGIAWALGEPDREPLTVPPGILECQAGAHLAAASMMALFVGGGPRIVDIALADILTSYVAVNCRFYIHHGMEWRRAGRRASNSGGAYPFVILPCKDGDVCLSGRAWPEWQRLVEAMGSPEWAKQPRYQKLRAMGQQYPEEVDALVLPWLRRHTKAEIAEIAHRHKLTIAPLRKFAEVLATPQFRERDFFKVYEAGGTSLLVPTVPFRISTRRAPAGEANLTPKMLKAEPARRECSRAKPLTGLRVLDFGWVWSAPQVGSILAQMGAEVIKIEHGGRLDNARLSGSVIRNGHKVDGPSTEMSPMFHQINKGKLGITLNMKEPAAVELARKLAAVSDVVLENMSAGSMERVGLGYEALRSVNPRLIMLAMSGAGQFGPLSEMRTYAPVMSSFVGLESLVGYEGEAPVGALNFGLGDPNAAAHGLVAIFAALIRRDAVGQGCYVDLSQTESLLATLTPYLLSTQLTDRQPAPVGNTHPRMAPHGVYPAAGTDRWLTIAVADDRQWQALAALASDQDWATEPGYATLSERIVRHRELNRSLAQWTATQDRDALVDRLRVAGIAASPVQNIAEVWMDKQFNARSMMHTVELPSLGLETLFRAPWLFSDFIPEASGRGPMLGEHNERILRGLLGLSEDEFTSLRAREVIK